MAGPTDDQLLAAAEAALNPQQVGGAWLADVGCALTSPAGTIYTGASIGTFLGICAEQGAASALVSAEGPRVDTLVAVWRSPTGALHVLPPCGRCREFLRGLSQDNLQTRVLLGPGHAVTLAQLLPYAGWYAEPV